MGSVDINNCGICKLALNSNGILENQIVTCCLCSLPFHSKCKNINSRVLHEKIATGIVFVLCDSCIHSHKINSVKTSAQNELPVQKVSSVSEAGIIKSKIICKNNLRGICKFGNQCWYSHTKICWNMLGTGSCLPECVNRLFHDEVCENSRNTRSCFNLECEKYHIKGTRRYELIRGNLDHSPSNFNAPQQVMDNRTPVPSATRNVHPNINNLSHSHASPNVTIQRNDFLDQQKPSYASVITRNQNPQNAGQEPNPLKMLNTKVNQQQLRIQSTETLLHQLLEQSTHQNSQIQKLHPVINPQEDVDHLQTRFQNTEDSVKDLNAQLQNLNLQIQKLQQHPKGLQLQTQMNHAPKFPNPSVLNVQQQTHHQPQQSQSDRSFVYHYAGLLPYLDGNLAENATYNPI